MAEYMSRLFEERRRQPPKFDLLSMLAHGESTRDIPLREFMGDLSLLIVGGNDTARNSMTGGLLTLDQFPDKYRKLPANPLLVESLVPEIIRYVTPVIYMRRTTTRDTELGGKTIPAGSKVAMFYVSGNRDPDAIGWCRWQGTSHGLRCLLRSKGHTTERRLADRSLGAPYNGSCRCLRSILPGTFPSGRYIPERLARPRVCGCGG